MSAPEPAPRPRRPWTAYLALAYYVALAGFLLALGVILVWRPLSGWLDFWAHAAVGRWVWENGRVPDHTLFLWTASEPWVYHSWLGQLVFYTLISIGPRAVLGFTVLTALTPFAVAWGVLTRRGRPSSVFAVPTVLALGGIAVRLQTRPELFTGVCLSLLAAYLILRPRPADASVPNRGWRDALGAAAVFLFFVVWANLHGAVVLGVLLLGAAAACDLLQDRFDRASRRLALLAVLAPVAVCVNPYGPAYWGALRPVASSTFDQILEWQPPWAPPPIPSDMAVAVGVVTAAAVIAWALNPHRRWAQLAWLLMLGAMFASARRIVWPLTIVGLLVLAANAAALDPEALARRVRGRPGGRPVVPPLLRGVVRAAVLAWVALECLIHSDTLRPWQDYTPVGLGDGIVRFVAEHRLEGRVFNDYENSSYLQWRFAGRPPLYIDLLNAYPDAVMIDYRDVVTRTERGRRLLDEQGVGVVVLTTSRGGAPSLAPLADQFDADPRWVRVYGWNDGVVWVRRTAEYEHVWGRVTPDRTTPFAVLEQWGNYDRLVPAGRPEARP